MTPANLPSSQTARSCWVNRPLRSPSREYWLSWQPEISRTVAPTSPCSPVPSACWIPSYIARCASYVATRTSRGMNLNRGAGPWFAGEAA